MTTGKHMMMRSVTETLSDTAHEVIIVEREKNKSIEVDIVSVLESAVLTASIQEMREKIGEDEEKKEKMKNA